MYKTKKQKKTKQFLFRKKLKLSHVFTHISVPDSFGPVALCIPHVEAYSARAHYTHCAYPQVLQFSLPVSPVVVVAGADGGPRPMLFIAIT